MDDDKVTRKLRMNLNDRVLIIRPLFSCMIIEKRKKGSFTSWRIRYEVIDRVLSRIRRSAYSDRFPRGSAVIFLAVHSDVKNYPVLVPTAITHDRESMLSRQIKLDFVCFSYYSILQVSRLDIFVRCTTIRISHSTFLILSNLVYYNT